jgi:competence CoiA-like predicted nuclease
MEYQHDNNVYAHDITNHVKHISEVASGRKGYYCMGCAREMQAKKGEKYAHHFSHDPNDIDNKGKCTYSDETYRHQLAKDSLQYIE